MMQAVHEWSDVTLVVDYVPSELPRRYLVEVEFDGPSDEINVLGVWNGLLNTINNGGAGGDTFSPLVGHATIVDGPRRDDVPAGRYAWEIALGGVTSPFIRCLVERLRLIQPNRVRLISLQRKEQGSTPDMVSAKQVREWLVDVSTYPQAWPNTSYAVEVVRRRGTRPELTIELTVAGDITDEVLEGLRHMVVTWLDAVSDFVSDLDVTGVSWPVLPSSFLGVPIFAHNRTTLRAHIRQFFHARGPSFALLRNMVECFSLRCSAISRLRIVG